MATSTSNSTPITDVDPSATGAGRYLVRGQKWGGELGLGVTLDFSFPAGEVSFATPYGIYSDAGEWRGVQSLGQGEQSAARSALQAWSAVSGLCFNEVADNAQTAGEIRFASTTIDSGQEYAHAYFPNTDASAGDVWLSAYNWNLGHNASIARGSDDYQTLLHEIGHAVGLKHSFEGAYAMPAAHDNYFFTLMSYSARHAGDDGWASFYPTTPMYDDLVAIQALYGRNMDHNSGDTAYVFNDGTRYFETIDDAGGHDRIVYTGRLNSTIDLNCGRFSTLSAPISFHNSSDTRATVAIGPSTVIEDATGGRARDTIFGNSADNRLIGGAGDDALYGGAGHDILIGGAGHDTFYFNTALTKSNVDQIAGFQHGADTIRLSHSVFDHLGRGALNIQAFATGHDAHDAGDRIVYHRAKGALYFDADGSGHGDQMEFASVRPGTFLTASDIVIY